MNNTINNKSAKCFHCEKEIEKGKVIRIFLSRIKEDSDVGVWNANKIIYFSNTGDNAEWVGIDFHYNCWKLVTPEIYHITEK